MAKRKKRAAARKTASKRGKALHNSAPKRVAPKKAKKSVKKAAKKRKSEARGGVTVKAPARKRKQRPAPALEMPIETAIIDVIEEPAPGVMVISEFEAVRVALPDSDEANEAQSSRLKKRNSRRVKPDST